VIKCTQLWLLLLVGESDCLLRLNRRISFKKTNMLFVDGNLPFPIILGTDFLESNGIIIDAGNRQLSMVHERQRVELPMCLVMSGVNHRVYCAKNVVLGPRERRLVKLHVKDATGGEGCLLPGTGGPATGWSLAASLNYLSSGNTCGEIANLSSVPVSLKKGTRIGEWQPICLALDVSAENDFASVLEDTRSG